MDSQARQPIPAEYDGSSNHATNFIASHSTASLVIIVVLVILVVYMYAIQSGWFKTRKSYKDEDADEDANIETEKLIASINGGAA